ncbi:MAG: hypothetical protein ACKO7Z_07380 [Cyanobacteriota bacterium]
MSRLLPLAAALLLGVGSTAAASAQGMPQPPEGRDPGRRLPLLRLTPEQQQQLFPGRKSLVLEQQREHIALLERSRACVGRADSATVLNRCLQQERRDYQALRSRIRDQMRALFSANGIPFPEPERRPLRRGQPLGGSPQESI